MTTRALEPRDEREPESCRGEGRGRRAAGVRAEMANTARMGCVLEGGGPQSRSWKDCSRLRWGPQERTQDVSAVTPSREPAMLCCAAPWTGSSRVGAARSC